MRTPSLQATPFGSHWSLQDTRVLLEQFSALPAADAGTAGTLHPTPREFLAVDRRFEEAILGHLLYLAQRHGLVEPPHSRQLQVPWLDGWRCLCANEPLSVVDAMRLKAPFLEMACAWLVREGMTPGARLAAIHERFLQFMNEGNFRRMFFPSSHCQFSDLTLATDFVQWRPVFSVATTAESGEVVRNGKLFRELRPRDIPEAKIGHAVIPVPSGHVLISDWFRLPEFTAATKQAEEADAHRASLNSELGRARQTELLARTLGIVVVSVGDSTPEVFKHHSSLRVGQPGPEAPVLLEERAQLGRSLGTITTDLWSVCMIDKQVLIDVVRQAGTQSDPETYVERWLMEPEQQALVHAHVEPGAYHLYFAGDPERFAKLFASPKVALEGLEQPMCVLHPTELTLQPPDKKRAP